MLDWKANITNIVKITFLKILYVIIRKSQEKINNCAKKVFHKYD